MPPTSTVILRLEDSVGTSLIGLGPARTRTRITARGYLSAIGEGVCSGEAIRERAPFFRAGFGSAATSFPPSADFAAERDLRPRAGVTCESSTTSTRVGGAVGVTVGSTAAFGLRPSPKAFANVERRSE